MLIKRTILYFVGLLLIGLLFTALPNRLLGQNEGCVSITLLSNRLVINGSTNINRFQCEYSEAIQETLDIEILKDKNSYLIDGVSFKLKADAFSCGNAMMNHDFQKLLQTEAYPYITVRLLEFCYDPDQFQNFIGTLKGEFQLAGKTVKKHFPVHRKEGISPNHYLGEAELNIRDFGLTPPTRMINMIKVNELITVEILLNVQISNQSNILTAD